MRCCVVGIGCSVLGRLRVKIELRFEKNLNSRKYWARAGQERFTTQNSLKRYTGHVITTRSRPGSFGSRTSHHLTSPSRLIHPPEHEYYLHTACHHLAVPSMKSPPLCFHNAIRPQLRSSAGRAQVSPHCPHADASHGPAVAALAPTLQQTSATRRLAVRPPAPPSPPAALRRVTPLQRLRPRRRGDAGHRRRHLRCRLRVV